MPSKWIALHLASFTHTHTALDQGKGEVAMNVGVVGFETQGGPATVDGAVEIAQHAIGFPQVYVARWIIRPQ